ncbi:MAG: LacI family DNA-binding transcriptional regulator [Micromonosporaceae bacterium]|nr:LacI family DNA-binding transcriptional regulator [Micromonosporaceae bacterium]
MRDVAREAGVGVTTVSRVVNNAPSVQPEYVERVRTAISKLGFRRNTIGRDLRMGRRTATIGLIVEDLRNPFYSLVAYEVEQIGRSHDTLLVTASSDEDPIRERELIKELCQRDVDGLIIVPTATNHAFCQPEIDKGVPMVFLDRPPDGVEADLVLLDNAGGALAGTRRLIEKGHRRIGVIGYEISVFTIQERVRGFRAAMAEAGFPVDERLLRFGSLTPADASADVAALLDAPQPPTAFFCCNNRITVGVLDELWRRRLQLDVAGFDDVEFADFLPRPVTLIVYDIGQLARRAAELLFRRTRDREINAQRIMVPTRVITRGRAEPYPMRAQPGNLVPASAGNHEADQLNRRAPADQDLRHVKPH